MCTAPPSLCCFLARGVTFSPKHASKVIFMIMCAPFAATARLGRALPRNTRDGLSFDPQQQQQQHPQHKHALRPFLSFFSRPSDEDDRAIRTDGTNVRRGANRECPRWKQFFNANHRRLTSIGHVILRTRWRSTDGERVITFVFPPRRIGPSGRSASKQTEQPSRERADREGLFCADT